MKKLILLSAVLLGTVASSQAGVHVDFGFGFPLPPIPLPGRVVVSHPAPIYRAPVCAPVPRYCEPAPRYCEPRYYSYPSSRYGYSSRGRYDSHSSYNRGYSGWNNYGGHRR